MRTWALIAAALGVACAPDGDPASSSGSIINGTFDNGDPAVVALTSSTRSAFCSGTLISSRVVLTAGHCVYTGPTSLPSTPGFIYVGSRTSGTTGQWLKADHSRIHPDYEPNQLENDVAVVILEDRTTVPPIAWNRASMTGMAGARIRIVGFGYQEVGATGAYGEKYQINLSVDDVDATEVYTPLGICNGDSGGPGLIVMDGVETLVGVSSWVSVEGCGGYGASERVDIHAAWLQSILDEEDPISCELDWRCAAGCAQADPDCPCSSDDGFCSPLCADTDSDADCPQGCGENGTCLGAECPNPDPDCGDPCGDEGHCVESCTTRDPDCQAPIAAGGPCGRDFDCGDGVCLPEAGGDGKVCELSCSTGPCPEGYECKALTQAVSVCRELPPPPDDGCLVAPGGHGPGGFAALLLGLLGLRAVRRKKS
jgi:MYXO-CTERM domain-containing protein